MVATGANKTKRNDIARILFFNTKDKSRSNFVKTNLIAVLNLFFLKTD